MNQIITKFYKKDHVEINVNFTDKAFFNATEIAKHFSKIQGKRRDVSEFLSNKQTKEYIDALIESQNNSNGNSRYYNKTITYSDLVVVKQGRFGQGGEILEQGTWLHPKLAILFARWLDARFAIWCDLQIEEILKQQSENAVPKISHEKYQIALEVAKTTSELLRLSDTSKLRMMYKICETYQVDSQFLPYYVEQNSTGSLTDLLDEFKLKHLGSARKINLILEKLGIIEKITRKSTSSPTGQKQFWSLTSKGLEFGKNESSAQNPRETHPHYFRENFLNLIKLIQNKTTHSDKFYL